MSGGPHVLPPLPWAENALEPHMSAETIQYHYGKHHATYVANLNKICAEDGDVAKMSMEEIIKTKSGGVFNQAAQAWNHTFFWNSLSPSGGNAPTGKVADLINRDFGSFEEFKKQFTAAAVGHFGSGWAWLVADNGKLKVVQGHDAGCPLRDGQIPIINCDVWEHAYYIDYRNARPKYVEHFWEIVNWDFANKNVVAAGL
ncbi:iron-dependent superoxide dismutase, putative [Perkinsus marinus ATCC 50983]|uniref:Superoxide dismutase n=1 Tax=Perkinsus marinus (strain ATCC 50983 / TXsc) TaxID=423536 RepID=C5L4W8_PERM5|nr:iron-dependent superoxide dismutase, putative [Perkinsus marinus ATCC 50983]EER08188.1 iron-dependent superoxide dismutase, putative [Perkinsus marinus ATCC 50983]|eukprot:XP_002776372.1 iron-dependent superoxide dismutase, putative [Perkinsus marinus ATCC 50983]